MTTATLAVPSSFTAHDRCDRCGAQAMVRATFTAGFLLFCGHHGRQHLPVMVELAVEIHDEGMAL